MKLTIYGLNYAPEPTGTGKYTGDLAEWLVAHGVQVEAIAWLRERGFALRGVYHMAYDPQGRAVQADFLFGHQGRRNMVAE